MIKDELFPALMDKAPTDDDQAISRLANLCAVSGMLVSIVGSAYKDVEQLRRTLRECQYLVECKVLMNGGQVITYKMTATSIQTQAKYAMIVSQVAGRIATVDNCVLLDPGDDADQEAVKDYRDGLKEAKDEA
jgi:hypothetical protein